MEKNKKITLGVGLGLLAAAGIGFLATKKAEGGGETPPPPGKAALSGYVLNAVTEEAIADAQITLGEMEVFSNSMGYFSLGPFDPGVYTVDCVKYGYQNVSISVELSAGNNLRNISLVPGSGATAVFEYASSIRFSQPGSGSGMIPCPIEVDIKNISSVAGMVHAVAVVKSKMGSGDDIYARYTDVDMGERIINPGQTLTFSGTHSAYPDEEISFITITSEAGTISSEFGTSYGLISYDIPNQIQSEEEYWAQVVLKLPQATNRGFKVKLELVGNYGLNFSTIRSPAVKADIMPSSMQASLRSYTYNGEGVYTVKGVWGVEGTSQVQRQASATYQYVQSGTGITITKGLPAGIYKLMLSVIWIQVYPPNGLGQSGTLIQEELGTIVILPAPGLPSGIYNLSGPASAAMYSQVTVTATARNGSPQSKTFVILWITDWQALTGYTENQITVPANSDKPISWSFNIPAWMYTWGPIRVFCSMREGSVVIARQETSIIISNPLGPGYFVCYTCGQIFTSEELWIQHMATH